MVVERGAWGERRERGRERWLGQGCGRMPTSQTTGKASVHASTAHGAQTNHAADPESVVRFQETLKLRSLAQSTQAEYVRTPHADTSLYPIPDGADEEALVMLSDILPTGFE